MSGSAMNLLVLAVYFLAENIQSWLLHSKSLREVKVTFKQAGYKYLFKVDP